MVHEMVGLVVMCLSYVMCRMLKIDTEIKKEENMERIKKIKLFLSPFCYIH